MRVLVACEESQTVCKAFRERGHEAYSCDIIDCSGGHPEWHIKGNVLPILNGNTMFRTADSLWHEIEGGWDLVVAHPPCTYLTVSGNRWFNESRYHSDATARYMDRLDGIRFFMQFVFCSAPRLAIENPIGIMSSVYRAPDQVIQPYEYGHANKKSTCLWLRNLPKLQPTNIVEPNLVVGKDGKKYDKEMWYDLVDERGKHLRFNDPIVARLRSKTFQGIADAMADQWGNV